MDRGFVTGPPPTAAGASKGPNTSRRPLAKQPEWSTPTDELVPCADRPSRRSSVRAPCCGNPLARLDGLWTVQTRVGEKARADREDAPSRSPFRGTRLRDRRLNPLPNRCESRSLRNRGESGRSRVARLAQSADGFAQVRLSGSKNVARSIRRFAFQLSVESAADAIVSRPRSREAGCRRGGSFAASGVHAVVRWRPEFARAAPRSWWFACARGSACSGLRKRGDGNETCSGRARSSSGRRSTRRVSRDELAFRIHPREN